MVNFHESKQDDLRMLDEAIDMHIEWTRRAFRCAVLNELPEPTMMHEDAHLLCNFGQWLYSNKDKFEYFNLEKTLQLDSTHQKMHDSIRQIFLHVSTDKRVNSLLLDQFEQSQSELITLLNYFKTKFIANALQYDSLTGLPLRYGLNEKFAYMSKSIQQNHRLFFLALMDIDHFKRVNDTHGHQVGDQALVHIAKLLKATMRETDHLYRFGGEEFLVLFEAESLASAKQFSQRLNQALRDHPLPLKNDKTLQLRMTIGVALVQANETFDDVLERADQALYTGKQAGRDRYIMV